MQNIYVRIYGKEQTKGNVNTFMAINVSAK